MADKIPLKLVTGGTPTIQEFGTTDTVPPGNAPTNMVTLTGAQAPTNKDFSDPTNTVRGPTFNRRIQQYLNDANATTWTNVGFKAAPTLSSSGGTFTNRNNDASGQLCGFDTTTSTNDAEGLITASFDYTQRGWGGDWTAVMRTHTSIGSIRLLIGLWDANVDALAVEPSTNHVAMFRYDTGLDTTGFWSTVTSNGTTHQTTQGASAIVASTGYTVRIALRSAHVYFFVNDVQVADHATTLPGIATNLGFGGRVITLTTAAKRIYLGRFALEAA